MLSRLYYLPTTRGEHSEQAVSKMAAVVVAIEAVNGGNCRHALGTYRLKFGLCTRVSERGGKRLFRVVVPKVAGSSPVGHPAV